MRVRVLRLLPWAFLPLALLGLALSQVLRDAVPPQLYVEAPERVEADTAFELRVSADEPVTYTVRYAELEVERVVQNMELSLAAVAGSVPVEIRAVDGAGNVTERRVEVEGVPVPEVEVEVPERLTPGKPFTVSVRWSPAEATPDELSLELAGRPLEPHVRDGEAFAFASVPLGSRPGPMQVQARWRDGLNGASEAVAAVEVMEDPRPIQELRISSEVLAVATPDGRAEEAEALARAYAAAERELHWEEPFTMPVDGYGTSGFGRARRYGQGGNVSRHGGEDIAAPRGTPVRAANAGVVRVAGFFAIKGGFVMIDHGGGVSSHYFHQSAVHVEEGQLVERGEVIGEVGSTGLSTGPHLHWEVRVDEEPTDPLAWLDRTRP